MSNIILNMVLTSEESINIVEELFKKAAKTVENFSRTVEKANKSSNQLNKELKKLAAEVSKCDKAMQNLSSSEEKVNKSSSLLKKIFNKLADETKQSVKDFLSFENIIQTVKESLQFADDVDKLAESIGAPTEDISIWADAVGNINDFRSSIEGLANSKNILNELGISMQDNTGKTKSLIDILPEIANRMENMSKVDSLALGKKLGLGDDTIALLQKGVQFVENTIARQKELGAVSKEDALAFQEFNEAMQDIDHLIRTVAIKIANLILPTLTLMLNKLASCIEFLINNKTVMIAVISGLAAALLTVLLPAIFTILTAISPIIFIAVGIGIAIAAVVALIIGAFKLLASIYQWLVALVSIAIEKLIDAHSWLVSKVVGFIETIANIYQWLVTKATDAIEGIVEGFNFLCDVLSFIVGFFQYCFNVISSIISSIIVLFTKGPKEAIQYLSNALTRVFDGFFDQFPKVKKAFESLGGDVASGWDKYTAWLGLDSGLEEAGKKAVEPTLVKASNSINNAQRLTPALVTSSGQIALLNQRATNTSINVGGININSKAPAKEVADEVVNKMTSSVKDYYDNGESH